MNSTKKNFDSVAMMRSARDRISAAIAGMTLEEELAWLAARDVRDPCLRRLHRRATAPHGTADQSRVSPQASSTVPRTSAQ